MPDTNLTPFFFDKHDTLTIALFLHDTTGVSIEKGKKAVLIAENAVAEGLVEKIPNCVPYFLFLDPYYNGAVEEDKNVRVLLSKDPDIEGKIKRWMQSRYEAVLLAMRKQLADRCPVKYPFRHCRMDHIVWFLEEEYGITKIDKDLYIVPSKNAYDGYITDHMVTGEELKQTVFETNQDLKDLEKDADTDGFSFFCLSEDPLFTEKLKTWKEDGRAYERSMEEQEKWNKQWAEEQADRIRKLKTIDSEIAWQSAEESEGYTKEELLDCLEQYEKTGRWEI